MKTLTEESEPYDYKEIENFIDKPEKTYRDIISKLE